MGSAKALLRWRGEHLVHRLARVLIAAGADPCLVTVPEGGAEAMIRSAVSDLAVEIAHNVAPATGLIGSVRTALERYGDRASALIVAPVDAPFVDVDAVERLLAAARAPAAISVPAIGDDTGHPVVFERGCFAELRGHQADRGARQVVLEAGSRLVRVPCADRRLLADLNTREQALALGIEIDD